MGLERGMRGLHHARRAVITSYSIHYTKLYENEKRLEDYEAALDAGRLPVARGLELTQDDLVRRAVIQALACHFRVSIESIELAHLIDFRKYFRNNFV